MKVIFPHRMDGKLFCCPFAGYKISSVEDFIKLLKEKFYDEETGYPGLYFRTTNPEITIVFAGHQYEHPEGKPFSLFYQNDEEIHRWFSVKDSDQSWFELFDDSEEMDKKFKALDALFKAGFTVGFNIEL